MAAIIASSAQQQSARRGLAHVILSAAKDLAETITIILSAAKDPVVKPTVQQHE